MYALILPDTLIFCFLNYVFRLRAGIVVFFVLALFAACDHAEKRNIDDTPAFKSFIEHADQEVMMGRWKQALAEVDSYFHSNAYRSMRDTYNYYRFCYEVYVNQYRDYDRALLYTDSMEHVLRPYKQVPGLASQYALVHYWKGDAFFFKGRYKEAYQEYFKGRELGRQMLDECMLSDYSYRLGRILYKQQRYYESQLYFKEANYRMRNCAADDFMHNYRTQEVYGNIGLCFYHLGMQDSALYYFNESLRYQKERLSRETPKKDYLVQAAKGVVLGNMASAYEAKGDYAKAEELYKESIYLTLFLKREPGDGLLTNLKLADLYYKKGAVKQMYATLQQEKQLLDTMPNLRAIQNWNLLMSKYYAPTDPSLAYEFLFRHDQIRDSLLELDRALQESDVNEHLKNIERQQQILSLEQDSHTRKFYLSVAIAICILCVIAVFFVIYYLRRVRRYVRLLNLMNERVGDQKKQLTEAMERLTLSNQDKDKILRAVAHDLRSPIAAIYALADLSLSDDSLTEEQKENLELIKTASNNSLTLSKEILDSAILMQQNEMKLQPVPIAPFLTNIIELLRFRASEKGQSIQLSLPQTPVTVQLDAEKFTRVINNVVTNAIKFSDRGAAIIVRAEKVVDEVVLSIQDTGLGIPERSKGKIFDMFTEAKREGTGGEKPFGLGLSISKQIVLAHKGKIWFDSKEGAGTTFFISIPLAH